MSQDNKTSAVTVDSRGFISADGVCFGKLTSDGESIVVVDRDKRRSLIRGSRFVIVSISNLVELARSK